MAHTHDVTQHRNIDWWPRAALRRDEDFDAERKVTWLDLFFDLVFVVVLARLAHDVAHHITPTGVADFAIQFAAVFWAWNAFTYYIERFETNGMETRAFTFAAMASVAAMAIWTEGGLEKHYTGFALAYIATRSINMVQWLRACLHVRSFQPIGYRFVAGFAVTASLIAAGTALDGNTRRLVFLAAVVIDVATPLFTLKHQAKLPRLSTSKFPERFGLLTIIVLGESVVGVISGLSDLNEDGLLGPSQFVGGGLALLVGIGLWWLYFDFIARRSPKPKIGIALAWVYLHLFTLAAITAVGATISVAIAESVEQELSDPVRYMLVGSAAAALLGLAALETTLSRSEGEPTNGIISPLIKALGGLTIATLGLLNLGWSSGALLSVVVLSLAASAVYGATVGQSEKPSQTNSLPTEGV